MNKETYTIQINDTATIELKKNEVEQLDVIRHSDGSFHVLKNNKAYKAEIVNTDEDHKKIQLKINGSLYQINIEDLYDNLVKQLGLTNITSNKINEIKAPMPGLVLDIAVQIGQEVKKGDGLLILEAMKMENIIKSGGDGIVKEILIEKGTAVDKGQLLIQME